MEEKEQLGLDWSFKPSLAETERERKMRKGEIERKKNFFGSERLENES